MLSPNLLRKLELLAERHEEVGRMLNDPAVIANNNSFREHSQEYAQLDPIVSGLAQYKQSKLELADAVTGGRRHGVDEDHAAHALGTSVGHAPRDVAAAAVPDHHGLAGKRVEDARRIVDPVGDPDLGRLGRRRTEARQSERMHAVPCSLERGDHVVPAGGVEPESRYEDDVHDPTVVGLTDLGHGILRAAAR